jgi:hypothetical protein
MISGTPHSSSFSTIITSPIIRNEFRYPGQQFIFQYYNTTNNQECTHVPWTAVHYPILSFLIISDVIILENELLSGVPEFIPDY